MVVKNGDESHGGKKNTKITLNKQELLGDDGGFHP